MKNYPELTIRKYMVKVIDNDEFIRRLKNKKSPYFQIFYDLETLLYNTKADKPSEIISIEYVVYFGFKYGSNVYVTKTMDIIQMFDVLVSSFNFKKQKFCHLLGVNINRYDNNFIHYAFKRNKLPIESLFPKVDYEQQIEEGEHETVLLESRVRTANNLEVSGVYKNMKFVTKDIYPLTQMSVETMGKMLVKEGILDQGKKVGAFDYNMYNLSHLPGKDELERHRQNVFNFLPEEQIEYGAYDVAVSVLFYHYYPYFFPGFKRTAKTLVVNIMDSYVDDNNRKFFYFKHKRKQKTKVSLRDVVALDNRSLYNILRLAFHGGLNFYNDKLLGLDVFDCFSIDENSAYTGAMHGGRYPYTFKRYVYNTPVALSKETKDLFSLSVFTIDTFNDMLNNTPYFTAKMFSKYLYSNDKKYVVLSNMHMLTMYNLGTKGTYKAELRLEFDTHDFPAKEPLEKFYRLKAQGKKKHVLDMEDIRNIKETDEPIDTLVDDNIIYVSKVKMNGFYGGNALRPTFNYFELLDDGPKNHKDLVINSERNLLNAINITATNFYNLLKPLFNLTPKEIEENFVYCDTDSLYLKLAVKEKIMNNTRFDPLSLGAWDVENEHIKRMYVFNHKKYCYESEKGFVVHAGGVNKQVLKQLSSYDECKEKLFTEGTKIQTLSSILNVKGSITLYNSVKELVHGGKYNVNVFYEDIPEEIYEQDGEGLYLETGNKQLQSYMEPEFKAFRSLDEFMGSYNYLLTH